MLIGVNNIFYLKIFALCDDILNASIREMSFNIKSSEGDFLNPVFLIILLGFYERR